MGRTRSALLQATADCVARYGIRKTTMVDVASKSGVAKATLYNHFRTKDDVLAAMVEHHLAELVGVCVATAAADGLPAALTLAAQQLASSPPLRKAAESEQALLAPLLTPGEGRGWQLARDGAAAVLTAGRAPNGPAQVELLLRWCASQVLWPSTTGVAALVQGLGDSGPRLVSRDAVPSQAATEAASGTRAGLGWPA